MSGVFATLLADNDKIKFNFEKVIRIIMNKPLISLNLNCVMHVCRNGDLLLLHCIGISNRMWFTTNIPNTYFLSHGNFSGDAAAYKPALHFTSTGMDFLKDEQTGQQLLKEYSERVSLYKPDSTINGMDLKKGFPIKIIVLIELIENEKYSKNESLNESNILGNLYAAVNNPMPEVSPGDKWDIRMVSEKFQTLEYLKLAIPSDLAEKDPLGSSSVEVAQMENRPLGLHDLNSRFPTWPLRISLEKYHISVKAKEIDIKVKNPDKQKLIRTEILKDMLPFRKKRKSYKGGVTIQ